ncbi:BAB2_0123 family type IV secretion system effector [Bartonella sp. DGB2]|uniref:BAB2_0123 family type IV secretion system effector n=1 Tax=Bartonella sp. DGB2 TaxID=3388426 RepID=UPI0039903859
MSWLIINLISAAISAFSLSVFIAAARKLTATVQLGRALATEIQSATASLDQAIKILREEHQDFQDENRKLDARISESTRTRRNIDQYIAKMENMRLRLQQDYTSLYSQIHQASPTASKLKTTPPAAALQHPSIQIRNHITPINTSKTVSCDKAAPLNVPPTSSKGLPVFVQRKIARSPQNKLTIY